MRESERLKRKVLSGLEIGTCEMIVRAIDGSAHLVPIPIRILPK